MYGQNMLIYEKDLIPYVTKLYQTSADVHHRTLELNSFKAIAAFLELYSKILFTRLLNSFLLFTVTILHDNRTVDSIQTLQTVAISRNPLRNRQ